MKEWINTIQDWMCRSLAKQRELQKNIKGKDNDFDIINPVDMYNSATAMIVEVGEALQEDTRWKPAVTCSKKIPYYHRENFKEEVADVFIFFMNILIYAGISFDEFTDEVDNKMNKNLQRLWRNDEK